MKSWVVSLFRSVCVALTTVSIVFAGVPAQAFGMPLNNEVAESGSTSGQGGAGSLEEAANEQGSSGSTDGNTASGTGSVTNGSSSTNGQSGQVADNEPVNESEVPTKPRETSTGAALDTRENEEASLELAEEGWKHGRFELNESVCLSDEPVFAHGVTVSEELKVPILLYAWTGNPHYRDLALRIEQKVEDEAMLPDGVLSSAEHLVGRVANHSHETCNITDFSWSMGYYLMTTGDAKWGDRIERVVFNAAPGAIEKDFKSLQYFSSVNQFIATGTSNNNETMRGNNRMQYRAVHDTECCVGNIHRVMPNYVSRMWLRSSDGGVVAALLGPSELTVPLSEGGSCVISEQTAYPFEDEIAFHFSFRRSDGKPDRKKHRISFQFRIPAWAEGVTVTLNGRPLPFPSSVRSRKSESASAMSLVI